MCCSAKSSATFEKRHPLRHRLAIRAIAAPQRIHVPVCRDLSCGWKLLRSWRHRPLLVPRHQLRQFHGSVAWQMNFQQEKRAASWPPSFNPSASNLELQIWPIPPSTLISTPVMYDASCDAKNATAPATSSGCPNRFIGTLATTSFTNSSTASFGSPVLPKIGVTIGPGATVFTRMPRPASSAAAVRAKERSAAFVAEYALVPAVPFLSATLVFKMIDAPSLSNGSAFWIVKYAPLTLMSNCSSYRLSGVSASGANFATPAFTNSTSIFPSFCETSAYSLSTSVSLATSACTATTPFPIVLTASSSVFLLRPEMATLAPSSCKRLAVASPMPLLPPVTTATFPSSLFMSVSLSLPDFLLGPLPGGIHADPPGASKISIFR